MQSLLQWIPWYGWVAIVAIVCGCLSGIVKSIHRHEQRMAMIKKGMDPSSMDDKDE